MACLLIPADYYAKLFQSFSNERRISTKVRIEASKKLAMLTHGDLLDMSGNHTLHHWPCLLTPADYDHDFTQQELAGLL